MALKYDTTIEEGSIMTLKILMIEKTQLRWYFPMMDRFHELKRKCTHL